MLDVSGDRASAIRQAETLMSAGQVTGVKVVKETYNNETGDYLTLKIFEDGVNKIKTDPAQEDVPHALPCFKPDDLYSYHARATMARLLGDFLARQKITVTELIHRADALEKFEATGTLYQHAIQKVAVAQAASTTTPVQQIIKSLNELVTKAINRVYRDARKGVFGEVKPGGFARLADSLAQDSDASYRLNGAIARAIVPAKGWDEKLLRLLAILEELPGAGAGRVLLADCTESIVAEVLNGGAALHELIGDSQNLGAALDVLVELFLARNATEGQTGLAALARHFAADELPAARTAIANRIMAELKSVKNLCPNSLVDELKTLRRIANKLVLGQGKYLSHEDLIAAFTLRSKRLVTHESVSAHLAEAHAPDEKLERLFLIEENIIGAENKRQLAAFAMPLIGSSAFEQHFLFARTPVVERLRALSALQARALRSGFQDIQKAELANALDAMAAEIEARARLLEAVEAKAASHVDKAIAILKLCMAGLFTEGVLSTRARALVLRHIGQPGFLTGYIALQKQNNLTTEAATSELVRNLEKLGINQDTGLKTLAA
ncbi:MAG TPA: hypothetical protein VMH86_04575 [Rhizomicrobium sp.]|nr:hypothetical protein [Rhizomicrobium sp.]